MDYSQMIPKLAADIQYLKALMARSVAATSATTATDPAIDFCCDLFDRSDQPVLDGNWKDSYQQWAIRSNRLIPQAPPLPTSLGSFKSVVYQLVSHAEFANSLSGTLNGATPASGISAEQFIENGYVTGIFENGSVFTTYAGAFRSPDLIARVRFEIPQSAIATVPLWNGNTTDRDRSTASGNYGIYFSDDAAHKFGINVGTMNTVHAQSHAVSATGSGGVEYNPPGGGSAFSPASSVALPVLNLDLSPIGAVAGWVGDFASLAKPIFRDEIGLFVPQTVSEQIGGAHIDAGNPQYTTRARATINKRFQPADHRSQLTNNITQLVLAGENELAVTATGTTYTFSLNGVIIAQETGAYITRSRVGMCQGATAMLTNMIASGVPFAGITSFKAWRADVPEPPNQTGRGTYEAGRFVYNDKYHTTDTNGNTAYNPLA